MPSLYASLDALKQHIGITDTQDDSLLLVRLATASRQIDLCTRHQFFVTEATRRFTTDRADRLLLKNADLLSVTSLATDTSGDRTYGTTWAATDYDLGPEDAPYDSPPAPYWRIDTAPGGQYGFPTGVRGGVQITGRWGYYEQLFRQISVLRDPVDSTETSLPVSNAPEFAVGQTLRIDDEQMLIEAIAGNNLTVVRGLNGSTPAAHLEDAPIDVYVFPVVHEACLLQAARLWTRKDSPVGWVGSNEIGTARVWSQLDPDARMLLAPLRAVGVF